MRKLSAPTVFIVSSSNSQRLAWKSLLEHRSNQIWVDQAAVPSDLKVELLLTDSPDAGAPLRTSALPWFDDEVGIVVCSGKTPGESDAADAWLPENIDADQLLLVCELVAEIARLRRRCRQGGRQRRLLGHLAMTDPLTGLPNRWAWEEEIRRRTELARQTSQLLCITLVDLDEFKQVNDTLGHARGDAVLRAAAHELVGQLRQDDFVARLGGDEFGLLLMVDSDSSAAKVVERIRAAVSLEAANDQWLTASAGMAIYNPAIAPDFAQAYNAADRALQDAKRAGRNQTVVSPTCPMPITANAAST
jgi:diguanylate cyclase (GGDEF)-like protein